MGHIITTKGKNIRFTSITSLRAKHLAQIFRTQTTGPFWMVTSSRGQPTHMTRSAYACPPPPPPTHTHEKNRCGQLPRIQRVSEWTTLRGKLLSWRFSAPPWNRVRSLRPGGQCRTDNIRFVIFLNPRGKRPWSTSYDFYQLLCIS
jgi:hypothetical protein